MINYPLDYAYPSEVTIETSGVCNARCVFCPHDTLPRKSAKMSDELFRKIVAELKTMPPRHTFRISPFKVNEMLVDKTIWDKLAYINEQLPNAFIRFFSNLNSATETDIDNIFKIKRLHDINISLNSLDSTEYRELMGLDLDRTVQNISALLARVKENGLDMFADKLVFSRVSVDDASDRKYLADFDRVFGEYREIAEPFVLVRGEWIDHNPTDSPLNQDNICVRYNELNICCDGVLAFCCMDGKAAYPHGNANNDNIIEIYNSEKYRKLRSGDLLKRDIEPCKFCSL
ncbi:MAG: SPASM domain-containing protein [Oscillospiraceae bacterium]|jgi:MoaA/NifB/PqqE/SkfB family radical SAM enzyme|nr:SPASM domain-containing protein [Oscillospiraceae bacterium]